MTFAELIDYDRGLGTAYERYYFYKLLDRWADQVGAQSFLEGPVDGMAGVPGVHGVGLARRGIPVVSVVQSALQAQTSRAIYEHCGASADVRVMSDISEVGTLPRADLVVAYHALSFVPDWRDYLQRVMALAKKAVVVTVCNPQNWGVDVIRAIGRVRRVPGLEPPESWRTEVLAPELWRHGRVKEHEYFDCPWWPDLQVSPGESLLDRAKKLVLSRRKFQFTADGTDSVLAEKFVYGAERWPYFGGAGWADELEPALRRHPSFEHTRSARLRARTGHLHAFLIDVTPRTPRERRRLAMTEEA